eukprot:scaffold205403_cov40-Tisochrysis_lutea.AAC.1
MVDRSRDNRARGDEPQGPEEGSVTGSGRGYEIYVRRAARVWPPRKRGGGGEVDYPRAANGAVYNDASMGEFR